MRMYNRRHFPLGESISTWYLNVKNIRGEVAVVLSFFIVHIPHFLENLACLCFGGAHFKQCVSTVEAQKVKRLNFEILKSWTKKEAAQLSIFFRCYLLLEVSYTGHFWDVPLQVWEWHRWHADLSSTWPCSEIVVCWWCHSEWCLSSDCGWFHYALVGNH